MNDPLVSLIIPVYNGEAFIQSSYDQACAQTYSNLEIIYIDNVSTDQSVDLIQKLQLSDNRVYLYSEPKKGAGAARNCGLRHAKGSIVSFFDVDDQISPTKVSSHVELLQREPEAALVFGQLEKIYENKNKGLLLPPSTSLIQGGLHKPYKLALQWMSNFGDLINPTAVTCWRYQALSVGGFEESLLRGEDAAFLIKMALNYTVCYDPILIGKYIRHPDSTIAVNNKQLNESPYLSQHKQFYTPFVFQFAAQHKVDGLRRWYEQLITRILIIEGYKLSRGYWNRIVLMKDHLKDFLRLGFSIHTVIVCRVVSYLPKQVGLGLLHFLTRYVFIRISQFSKPG